MGRDANIEREQAVLQRLQGLEMDIVAAREEIGEVEPELRASEADVK